MSFKDKDQNMISKIKNEPLKVPKKSLFNLQKHALTTSQLARQMLNRFISWFLRQTSCQHPRLSVRGIQGRNRCTK